MIQEVVADAQGAILITGIQAGTCRLSAAAPGYAPRLLEYGQYGTNDYRMADDEGLAPHPRDVSLG